MAWAVSTTNLVMTVKFKDYGNDTVERRYSVIFDTDIATTVANLLADLAVIAALSNAEVSQASMSLKFEDSAAAAAVAGAEAQTNLALTMYIDPTAPKTWTTEIPAPKIGLFQGATGNPSKAADLADTDLLAFAAMFQTTGGSLYVSDGETIDDTTPLAGGIRVHRASRKG